MLDIKRVMNSAKHYGCELCRDSGICAHYTSNGHYKCAGPVPEDARHCFEAFCTCPLGVQMEREERR